MGQVLPMMPHQREAVDFAKGRFKTIIAHGMRLGKSRVAIEVLLETMNFPAMIVCPAFLRWNWYDEVKTWMPNAKVQVLVHLTDRFKRGADFHIVSYEYITQVNEIPLSHIRMMILDEAQYLKNIEAKRTERVQVIVEKYIPRILMLSGTIMPNRPAELYPILRMMGAIKMDWINYAETFCDAWDAPWGYDTTGASRLDDLQRLLAPLMDYKTKEMVLDNLPAETRQVIALDLPLDKREKDFNMAELQRTDEPLAIEGLTDLMKIVGMMKVPGTIKFVEDLLTKTNKVVVFFQYHDTADALQEGLKRHGVLRSDGKTTSAVKDARRKAFQKEGGHRIFLMQVTTAMGVSLWRASTTVFAEASWVPSDLRQAEERVSIVHGEPQPLSHYYMTLHGSVDEHQLRRTLEKLQVINRVVRPAA